MIVDVVENNTPDFEKFDTIYIKIKVTDTQQTYGTNTNAGRNVLFHFHPYLGGFSLSTTCGGA